jgi:hypothetical protein
MVGSLLLFHRRADSFSNPTEAGQMPQMKPFHPCEQAAWPYNG